MPNYSHPVNLRDHELTAALNDHLSSSHSSHQSIDSLAQQLKGQLADLKKISSMKMHLSDVLGAGKLWAYGDLLVEDVPSFAKQHPEHNEYYRSVLIAANTMLRNPSQENVDAFKALASPENIPERIPSTTAEKVQGIIIGLVGAVLGILGVCSLISFCMTFTPGTPPLMAGLKAGAGYFGVSMANGLIPMGIGLFKGRVQTPKKQIDGLTSQSSVEYLTKYKTY